MLRETSHVTNINTSIRRLDFVKGRLRDRELNVLDFFCVCC